MKKDVKAQRIDELKGLFDANGTYYLFNYNKMTVAQATALRKNLRKQGSSLKIVKNRLALRSVPEPLAGALKPVFRTPTAVAYTNGDAVVLAKALKEFQAANKVLVLKGGVVEGALRRPRAVRRDRQAPAPDGSGGQGRRPDGRPVVGLPPVPPGPAREFRHPSQSAQDQKRIGINEAKR